MQHATQVALTRRVLDFVDRETTELAESVYLNPVADYASPDQLALERQKLFREYPLLFGLSCQVPRSGDYMTSELGGVPLLVVRGDDGTVRAFLNVCRHRGAKVASGCGSDKRAFVCPYHAWTYDTRGRLRKLAPSYAFTGLDADDRGLVQLPCHEEHGFIWVTATPDGRLDQKALLGGLGSELASYDFAAYHHYETRVLRKKMNWKLVIDTFLETWHVATLHTATVAPIFLPNVNVHDAFGRNGRLVIPRRSLLKMRDEPEAAWNLLRHSAIVYQLFPNALLVWQGDHLEVWRAFPAGDAPDECIAEASLFTPAPADTAETKRHWDRNMDLLMATVEEEDFPVCLDIQKGFASGAQGAITFGRNEPALSHYHRSIRQSLDLVEIEPLRAEGVARRASG